MQKNISEENAPMDWGWINEVYRPDCAAIDAIVTAFTLGQGRDFGK